MLCMLQRVESIDQMQAGFSLEDHNIHARYILHKDTYLSPQSFLQTKSDTHSYVMVFICKMKLQDTLMSQKWPVQTEVLQSL